MGIEFELKYQATAELLDAIAKDLQGTVQQFEMRTTYYDTADRQLSARRWTLRQRLENHISVCTFKTPGTDNARVEFEVQCDQILPAIPALCKLSGEPALAVLAAKGLLAICGARFHRTAVTVQLEDAVAEVALDLGVLQGGNKELPLCEVEVEWKDGNCAAVAAYGAALAERYGLKPEHQSKFRRASLLAGGN